VSTSGRERTNYESYQSASHGHVGCRACPFISAGDTVKNFYTAFPQGYLKLVKGNFYAEIGALPTLIGAEYTFTFDQPRGLREMGFLF
jgi:hypothetical protein